MMFKLIPLAALMLICAIGLVILLQTPCPNGYWSPVNHCSTICEGHNHSVNITYYPNGFYSCECAEGATGILTPVCT